MNNLRSLLKVYFCDQCPIENLKSLLDNDNHEKKFILANRVGTSRWSDDLLNYTHDELGNLNSKYQEDWSYLPNKNKEARQSIFNLLVHFNDQVLVEDDNEPFVVYQNLLKWKNVTMHIGEDILTSAFFAFGDNKSLKNRTLFSWKPYLFTNNSRLQSVLGQGVAENHSHLYASSLNFDFSWIALMNHYEKLKPTLKKITLEKRLHKKSSDSFNSKQTDYCLLISKAVTLRFLLYNSINYFKEKKGVTLFSDLSTSFEINLESLFSKDDLEDTLEYKSDFNKIVKNIAYLKETYSYKLSYQSKKEVFDYLIPKSIPDQNFQNFFYLYGERTLLYECFKIIFSSNYHRSDHNVKTLERLFYSYLLIKNDFRKEMVQLNGRYGFGNFKEYQDKKFYFLDSKNVGTSLYATAFLDVSFNIYPKSINILSNEFRIGPPGKSVKDFVLERVNENSIVHSKGYFNRNFDAVDYILNNKENIEQEDNHFYVLHFFKRKYKSKTKSISGLISCRDAELRENVRKQSLAIVEVREKYSLISNQIKGIDAASSELAARPEVFGQAFRYLKNHHLKDEHAIFKERVINHKLKATFHAGEDFLDIADGLRYIDECIMFLGICDGERLGHALALGIDVDYYYQLKNKTILLSKQMLLDNIVWILNKSKKFGLIEKHLIILNKLEDLFNLLASEIYSNPIRNKYSEPSNIKEKDNRSIFSTLQYNQRQFYDAWKLRGDNPENYRAFFEENKKNLSGDEMRYWDRCAINNTNHKHELVRQRKEICFLYYEYHYNNEVRKKGNEIKQFKITDSYIKLLKDLQHKMLKYIAKRNIAIETNPSSNFLIGTVDRYIDHPIFKFNSKGLNIDGEYESPLVSASINTDDSGIFYTSLENEYALLAIALEKEKDEYGDSKHKPNDIYDWIDHIRKMGLQQSFK